MKLSTVAVAILGLSNVVFAGTMGNVVAHEPMFYIGAEGGASIALDTRFAPKRGGEAFNTVTPANTDWTTNFGVSGLGGVFLGYNYNPNVAVQFTYDYRSGFDYYLNGTYGIDVTDPSYIVSDIFSANNIKAQTFLFDLVLKPTVNWGGFVPYVKGGIGFAYNTISNAHDAPLVLVGQNATFHTVYLGDSTTSFSWDAGVGADYYFNEKFSVGLGYRFVDAGKVRTQNRYFDPILSENGTVSAFETRHVLLSEAVASIAYHFDYAM